MRTTSTSQIEDDLAAGPRAAQQRIAGGWGLQRVGLVIHRARQQSGFAGMANPVRQDQRVGTSQASASSSRLAYAGSHGTDRPLRANAISGPWPGVPVGRCGGRAATGAMPGVSSRRSGEDLGVDAGSFDAESDQAG